MRPYVLRKTILRVTGILLCILLCAGSVPVWADTAQETVDTTAADTATDTTTPEQPATPERVLHVATGGEGDGSDSAHPMGDLSAAVTLLSESGGSIVVHGRYDITSASSHSAIAGVFEMPRHSGSVSIAGEDGFLVCPENYRIYLSGDTKIEHISISGSGSLIIAARYNKLTMGDGINIIGISDGVNLLGGHNGSSSGIDESSRTSDSYIEIRSGIYKNVCGYNRTTAKKTSQGKASIVILGGEVNCVCAGLSGYNNTFSENVMNSLAVSMQGGKVYKLCDVDMTGYGTLGSLSLEYTGGEIENIILADKVQSSISFSEKMTDTVKGILRHFDTYKIGEGESVQTEKIKVAFIGDSITGGLGTADPERESYPAQVGQMLGAAYEIGNFSEGGRCVLSSSGSAYLDSEAFADSILYMPDVVCIMLGTNDLSSLLTMSDAQSVLYRDMLVLIEKYTALDSKPLLYLLSPTVRTDDKSLEEGIRDIIIPTYKKISEDTGVGYVDIFTISQDMKHHLSDSVHPDEIACSYIATWLYNAIVSNSGISSAPTQPERVEIHVKIEAETTPPETEAESESVSDDQGGGISPMMLVVCAVGGACAMLVLSFLKEKMDKSGSADKSGDTDGGK